ncbi:hypothetical protein KAU11_06270 [Candidatus Babeliales bacterium]|nr:hypothetical protein [Candidatus Babeliales bacterium]
MAKDKGGRPTVMTPEVVNKLEEAFLVGATDLEACVHADISKQTLYNYCDKHPEFFDRKETLKNQPVMRAKVIVSDSLKEGDIQTAHKVIDRKEGSKVTQTVEHSGSIDTSITFEGVKVED